MRGNITTKRSKNIKYSESAVAFSPDNNGNLQRATRKQIPRDPKLRVSHTRQRDFFILKRCVQDSLELLTTNHKYSSNR